MARQVLYPWDRITCDKSGAAEILRGCGASGIEGTQDKLNMMDG